jgi:hypothetical protein
MFPGYGFLKTSLVGGGGLPIGLTLTGRRIPRDLRADHHL